LADGKQAIEYNDTEAKMRKTETFSYEAPKLEEFSMRELALVHGETCDPSGFPEDEIVCVVGDVDIQ